MSESTERILRAVKRTILIVDDDRTGRETLSEAVGEMGYRSLSAAGGQEALSILRQHEVDILLTDLKMPEMDGLDLLAAAKRLRPDVFVILVTAYATVDTAVEAMKKGAYDYIMKPIDLRALSVLLDRAALSRDLLLENEMLRDQLGEKYDFSNIIGRSTAMQEVYDQIRQVADTDTVVLIEGESGTGKELVANAIHANSRRKDGPFIKVNCAALPETLLESELFGHERGAFTGAVSQRKGRFELADGGSIFLDEIADLSTGTQAKLLRVLQNYEFQRVGGTETIRVDVRLIAATNADLAERVEEGRFREDLYYRLRVVPISLPPLRDRREDIPLLATHFVKEYAEKNEKGIRGIAAETMNILTTYPWPGNVRELQNSIENMVVMANGPMLTADLLPTELQETSVASDETGFPIGLSMRQIEEKAIRETLASVGGSRKRAAEILGISLRTLHRKINEYGIDKIRKG
ncbi:MAG: sigma-54 dependent transcriptional regulator [Planctomycetota bacterium]